ncbi:MAG: hypothetical protein EZS28_010507 [Streblomastix strix]|uniref:Hyaluronan/mRNA-binding protein domain-containing protein n=1 Tax=Streblomastix strix TaxID=222440 RepID=A0A5J4WHX3_9EUKA|nr:MAG: hypothetical protein EZS28_010507 [Streblomastix strix]
MSSKDKREPEPKNKRLGYGKTAAKGGAGGSGTWGDPTDADIDDYDPNDPNYAEEDIQIGIEIEKPAEESKKDKK